MPQLIHHHSCLHRPPSLLPLSTPLTHHHTIFRTIKTHFNPTNLLLKAPFNWTIRCMANPRRVKMVAKQIQRELSDMLLTDKVLQYAILPETKLGADLYLSSLTTITDVEVSTDLQVVKVFVSVFGDERGKEVAIAGLKSKSKYVRSMLGKRMKLRLTPEVRFIEDESLERGSRVIAILDRLKNEDDKEDEDQDDEEEESESSGSRQDDKEWDEDDPDEGIIYVN